MRRLILLRHAKSAWDDADLPDHDRVLNARGRRDCITVGGWLRDRDLAADQVLCSTALRTLETWTRLSGSLQDAPPAQPVADLYLAEPNTILGVLKEATGACVALIGHNPGIADTAASLVRTAPIHPDFLRFPTLSTLVVEFPIDDWAELDTRTGTVIDFIVPRDLAV
jgi:phosphohistidine phosphatase